MYFSIQADRQVDSVRERDVDVEEGCSGRSNSCDVYVRLVGTWGQETTLAHSFTFLIRYLAFCTLLSVCNVVMIWFLTAADSEAEGDEDEEGGAGELGADEEEDEEDDDDELNGLGKEGKDILDWRFLKRWDGGDWEIVMFLLFSAAPVHELRSLM